jgi:hypothetical protein
MARESSWFQRASEFLIKIEKIPFDNVNCKHNKIRNNILLLQKWPIKDRTLYYLMPHIMPLEALEPLPRTPHCYKVIKYKGIYFHRNLKSFGVRGHLPNYTLTPIKTHYVVAIRRSSLVLK